jgi:hypothetical protein
MNRIHKNIEADILRQAIEALGKHVPIQEEIHVDELMPSNEYPLRPNRLLRMEIYNHRLKFCVEIKTILTKTHLMMMQIIKNDLPYPPLVVAKYVNPQLADRLRESNIEFVDTAGNAFISHPPLYINVKGNKSSGMEYPEQIAPSIRTFKATGLKIIYALLCHPGLEKKTYREITAVASVALGTVNWIMSELRELGYLLNGTNHGHKLIQKVILLQRWSTIYPDQLRPKQSLGRYRGEHGWWQKKALDPAKAQWGGEVAAAKIYPDLKPQIITLYATPSGLEQLIVENGLQKDDRGDIEILRRFWATNYSWLYEDLVSPLLIYADLLATGNQVNIETARKIYETHLVQLIRDE